MLERSLLNAKSIIIHIYIHMYQSHAMRLFGGNYYLLHNCTLALFAPSHEGTEINAQLAEAQYIRDRFAIDLWYPAYTRSRVVTYKTEGGKERERERERERKKEKAMGRNPAGENAREIFNATYTYGNLHGGVS